MSSTMTDFEIAGLTVRPGELRFGEHPVGEWRGGLTASVPVMVMHGERPGLSLWVDACLHGDEVGNVEVIRRVIRERLEPTALRGTIVAVPVSNPFAFHVGTRGTALVHDYVSTSDAHDAFPGSPHGSLNDRLAHRLYSEAVKCDAIVNLHQTSYPAVPFTGVPLAGERETWSRALALAEAFGLPVTETRLDEGHPIPPRGWPILSTLAAGRPTFLVELVSTGFIQEPYVSYGVRGILNVMRALDMIDGEVEAQPGLHVPAGRYGRRFILAERGGLIDFGKAAGDWVETDEVFAVVRDVYGDVVDEVRMPMQGYLRTLLHGRHNQAIHEGSVVASVLEVDPARTYFA